MTAPTKSATCPDWCVSRVCDQDGVHVQEETFVVDLDGKPQPVSAFAVDGSDRIGVYAGDHEFSTAAAREFARLLLSAADAGEAGSLLQAVTR